MQFLLELDMDVFFRCWLTPEVTWTTALLDAQLQHVEASWPVVMPLVHLSLQVRSSAVSAHN